MEQRKLERINELAKKAKEIGLTEEEKAEQKILREEYIAMFKRSLTNTLENIVLVDENGHETPLKKKDDK